MDRLPNEMTITVRYFAGARAAAGGIGSETVTLSDDSRVTGLAATLADRHGAGLARVLDAASFLVNEIADAGERPIPAGATVDVLPPFAGG